MTSSFPLFTGFAFNAANLSKLIDNKKLSFKYHDVYDDDFVHKDRVSSYIILDFFHLILMDLIDLNSRYRFSTNNDAYFDYEEISGEEFLKQRKLGAFMDIDPFMSNCKAYKLVYKYKYKLGFLTFPVFVSARYKLKITDRTNAGIASLPAKTKTLFDYMDVLCNHYKKVPRKDILYIIKQTEKNIYEIQKNRGAVCFFPTGSCERRMCGSYLFIVNGLATYNFNYAAGGWRNRMRVKLRLMYMKLNKKWDGYYYCAVDDEDIAPCLRKKSRRKYMYLDNIHIYKLFEECVLMEPFKKNIIRIPYYVDFGWRAFKRNYLIMNFEYIYRRVDGGLLRIQLDKKCHNNLIPERNYAFLKLKDVTDEYGISKKTNSELVCTGSTDGLSLSEHSSDSAYKCS